jgi:Protein of unknown function (DUF1488)
MNIYNSFQQFSKVTDLWILE